MSTDQNKQLNNCVEKCYSCGGKGTYSQMHGVHGAEDFGGDGFDEKPTIHNYPCKPCNGTGFKPKSNYEGEEKCKNCDRENHGDFACREYVKKCCISDSLPHQENDWKEKFYTEFKSVSDEYPNTYKQILSFIESLLALREQEAYLRGMKQTYVMQSDEIRASRDQEWKRAINERIKHKFNGYGGKLGFTQDDLLALMSPSPEEEK